MAGTTPRGYLHVLSEPGAHATVEEFNDWYDNEHVPLRMGHIPEFLTGARYVASDSLTPSYLASYDISSTSLFSDPKYTTLRANRSVREGALVIRLETLDRRTCETVDWTSTPPAVGEAAVWTCTVSGEGEEGELREMEGVKGWRRTHRHRVYDALRTGYGKEPNMNDCPTFLVVHEFDDESYVDSQQFKKACVGKTEVRRWKLYKATPNSAPK